MSFHDYRYNAESPGFERAKIQLLMSRLNLLLHDEFPGLPENVRVVDYPTDWVRIINLTMVPDDVVDRLTDRADAVYLQVMAEDEETQWAQLRARDHGY